MNDFLEKCAKMLSDGESLEKVLSLLRKSGYSRAQSIKVVMKLMDCGLAEAKQIVHLSSTWSDLRDSTNRFHDSLIARAGADKKDRSTDGS